MTDLNFISIIYLSVIFALIILFIVSLTLFVRRLLIHSSAKRTHSIEMNKKLDKIIELLEKDKCN
ncbi:DUF4083 domain-containing protein [Brevibacillus daliensis]|uniref:DUF4083 domain-containing protein n=1 Tax=Brevibacillus daliensis TaxID=2892995 RepID=UPI001E5020FC|nr:DUF4083 domain-containing protein [Brevibacillus daliensis]